MEVDTESLRLPYSQRPEWSDVDPIHVEDRSGVVSIQYTAEHADAMAYFRAIMESGEKSSRALLLTEDMIGFNQADYTAWQLRWLVVEALLDAGGPLAALEKEYDLTAGVMQDNAKNYQLWNHRRKVALRAGPSSLQRELDFSMQALDLDDKNYHAWSHRVAVIKAWERQVPGLWEQELDFASSMLDRDVRNNSAWNHRAFGIKQILELASGMSSGPGDTSNTGEGLQCRSMLGPLLGRELSLIAQMVAKAPRNESAWNYLMGIFSVPGCRSNEMAFWPQVQKICLDALTAAPSCPPALAALSHYYYVAADASLECVLALREEAAAGTPQEATSREQELQEAKTALHEAVQNATSLLDGLTMADPIRSMYWVHRHQALQQLLIKGQVSTSGN